MPKYIVTQHGNGCQMYRVDAENEQQAKEKVASGEEEVWYYDYDVGRVEVRLRDEG